MEKKEVVAKKKFRRKKVAKKVPKTIEEQDKERLAMRYQFMIHAKISSDLSATVSTIFIWSGIVVTCVVLGGVSSAPMLAGTVTTIAVWILRRDSA